ncbi:endonuclease domain-containing protein [Mycobacterium sp. TY815]|uniref:endonuclease domain-containing protein n=1 Tax=Mycobacterium sp. TY815 TaxID=3050581 RepID=UPI0027424A46|nr:endonuclease domain-containing protein [Mycobacterium sp. TY815]MDP7703176.1 endonuclease domain-containing protein [Mycobacterium sp. TY815]
MPDVKSPPVSGLWKNCTACGELKSFDEFCVKSNLASGYNGRCKTCVRRIEDLRLWGITYEELQAIYGTVCNLCGRDETVVDNRSGRLHRLSVDHDHRCCKHGCKACIRGLLCRTCNYQLGVLEARPDWLRKALEYLGHDASWVVD